MAHRKGWLIALPALLGCAESTDGAGPRGSAGGAHGSVMDGGETSEFDAGVLKDAGFGQGGTGTVAPSECTPVAGGSQNHCDVAYLQGDGFSAFNGASVVNSLGRATITNGSFILPGDYPVVYNSCASPPGFYRIEMDGNGHCDDGVDLVFLTEGSKGAVTELVSGDARGVEAACDQFPGGYDLSFRVDTVAFPLSGGVAVALFESGVKQGESITLYPPTNGTFGSLLEAADSMYGLPGSLTPGSTYTVRYCYFSLSESCPAETLPAWKREFIAEPGLNVVELSEDAEGDTCFTAL